MNRLLDWIEQIDIGTVTVYGSVIIFADLVLLKDFGIGIQEVGTLRFDAEQAGALIFWSFVLGLVLTLILPLSHRFLVEGLLRSTFRSIEALITSNAGLWELPGEAATHFLVGLDADTPSYSHRAFSLVVISAVNIKLFPERGMMADLKRLGASIDRPESFLVDLSILILILAAVAPTQLREGNKSERQSEESLE